MENSHSFGWLDPCPRMPISLSIRYDIYTLTTAHCAPAPGGVQYLRTLLNSDRCSLYRTAVGCTVSTVAQRVRACVLGIAHRYLCITAWHNATRLYSTLCYDEYSIRSQNVCTKLHKSKQFNKLNETCALCFCLSYVTWRV